MPTCNGETYWWAVTINRCFMQSFKTRREARTNLESRRKYYPSWYRFRVVKLMLVSTGSKKVLCDDLLFPDGDFFNKRGKACQLVMVKPIGGW